MIVNRLHSFVSIPFYLLFLIYTLLAFFLYAALYAGLSAMVKRQDEAQNATILPRMLITINIPPQDAAREFSSVTLATRTSCDECVAYENHAPILILRQPKAPFIWTLSKYYD